MMSFPITSHNDVSFVSNCQEWGAGTISMTLALARFLWAGTIPVACWVIGGFPVGVGGGDPLETAVLGWGCPSARPRLRPGALCSRFRLALPSSLTSGTFLDCHTVCQRGQNVRPEKPCECSLARAQHPEVAWPPTMSSHFPALGSISPQIRVSEAGPERRLKILLQSP